MSDYRTLIEESLETIKGAEAVVADAKAQKKDAETMLKTLEAEVLELEGGGVYIPPVAPQQTGAAIATIPVQEHQTSEYHCDLIA